jgi:phosphohistidine phosphatase
MNRASISQSGTFKYIQIDICDIANADKWTIVRGFNGCPYHADVLRKFITEELKMENCEESPGGSGIYIYKRGDKTFKIQCPGGGRIEMKEEEKKIKIYGYSQGFGLGDHALTQQILSKKYTDYEITWTNDGY